MCIRDRAEAVADLMARAKRPGRRAPLWRIGAKVAYPLVLAALVYRLPLAQLPMTVQALLTLLLVVPMLSLIHIWSRSSSTPPTWNAKAACSAARTSTPPVTRWTSTCWA